MIPMNPAVIQYTFILQLEKKRPVKTQISILYSIMGFFGALEGVAMKVVLGASPYAPTFTVFPPFIDFIATGQHSIMQNYGLCAFMSKKLAAFFRFWSPG